MKTNIEIEFDSAKRAAQALKLLKETKTDELTRARVKGEAKGSKLMLDITAGDFTALRALTATTMRDLKVIIDSFAMVEKK